ncbi:hypothetical protein I204_05556 [Kwoniella mangroviensis CBS 8886]|nr:uncharacterized protein I203_07710 [Kwoniella mangroviensis CBS 8507]OCF63285.1 hypothetical protein I203_07710 [Kwoniella mangroviensis CBS 8507]OCF73712.1 hypothetical protein I204_05556 [Kwoniella mangroviensis CBS 8886]
MVKRSLSTSPPPSSPEQIKPSSPFSSIDERSSPKKSPRKSNTINNNEESWDADKRSVVAEMILEAGFKSTGLTTKQLRDALKFRHEGGTNLRSHLIKSVIPK